MSTASLLLFVSACTVEQPALRALEKPREPTTTPAQSKAATVAPAATTETAPSGPAASEVGAPEAVDPRGCVASPTKHAAGVVVSRYAVEVQTRLGRPARPADVEVDGACFAASTLPDLDGDGVEETEVVEGCSWGTAGGLHVLYLSNHGCARYAGDLVSAELTPLPTRSAGLLDLESTWSNGCAGRDFKWTRYRWDGAAYRVADEATCNLCDDRSISTAPPHVNEHPHCKAALKQAR